MTNQELKTIYGEICTSLAARRLKPAFDLVGKLISGNGLGVYYDEYMNLEETYHYMLNYTVEGVFDPERQKVYRKLIVSAFELADKINEDLLMRLSTSVEYEKKRMFRNLSQTGTGDPLTGLEEFYNSNDESRALNEEAYLKSANENQQKMQQMFYRIWFTDKLTSDEAMRWRDFFHNPVIPVHFKAYMVTAVMLSLQRFFDPLKFTILFENYENREAELNQRALTGLVINFYKYDSRLSFYPAITGRLTILNENPGFKYNIERIIIQFIRSKETEKLQQRIRDEILPEMIKINPNMRNKINLDSLMEEGLTEDKNPEWEDIFRDSPGLLNKMEEFSELQMKGDDVFMGSFSMLKSFPFFNEIGNWFLPFFPENPAIFESINVNDPTIQKLMEAIEKAPILCNSDKYSFCLSIQRLPKENLGFMTQAMQAEMEQLKELKADEELLDPGRQAEFISNQYIQDLYRFYKLFPRKGDFEDIFSWRLDFHNKQALGDILKEDRNVLRNIAEYYFTRDHFEDAAGIFRYLLEQEKDGELYQKLAWCHQHTGDFDAALDNYLKAELYEVNKLWNLKKIAICYRNMKKPGKALKYYQAAEKIDPESLSNQLNIGYCLIELARYDEALQCYFKVEYLAPGNKKVWRPIAWCSFLTGKKDQAEKYFMKLIDDIPNKHDLINMGHVQWSLGNRKAALDYYRKSISGYGTSPGHDTEPSKERFTESEFLAVFEEDMPHLISQGIEKEDIPIMLDQLRYLLEE